MKVYRDLYPQVISFENLYLAYRKAARASAASRPVAAFEFDLEANLFRLQDELEAETYRPGPYTSFYIHDPKRRRISAAPFRDRVVHHALCNVIEPIFERTFIGDSYANRVGKGTHARAGPRATVRAALPLRAAMRRRAVLPQRGPRHPARHPGAQAGRSAGDGAGGSDPGRRGGRVPRRVRDGILPRRRSVRRGAAVRAADRQPDQPVLGQRLPERLDQFVKRELRCPAYVRYVDDFLLFAESKRSLWEWKAAVCGRPRCG